MNDEKKQELKEICQFINAEYKTIKKLIFRSIHHAKAIGDRLLRVKSLVGHGNYERWVEEKFDGGLSTARAYTRIAQYKNWAKIAPKLSEVGGMTIEAALSLLKERQEEIKPDRRRENAIRELVNKFIRLVQEWPDKVLCRLAYDFGFIERIERTARRRNREINQWHQEEAKKPHSEQPLYYFPTELRKKV